MQITKLERKTEGIFLHITTKSKIQICPCCHNKTKKIHDYRIQTIKDIPYHYQMIFFVLKKRRYVCKYCGKRFYESYDFLAKYFRRTTRSSKGILFDLFYVCTKKEIAKQYQVSSSTVSRILKMVSFEKPKLPKVLCIDEFKGNAQTGKYQCILVDGKHHKVLDILKDRTFSYLQSYFSSYTRQERKRVEYFVCDLWSPYAEIARSMFPNAKIIAERYHFVRQVYWAVESVRKEKQKTMPKEQRKYFKRSKKLLLAPYASLKEAEKQAVDIMLWYHEDLRKAHDLKERFYKTTRTKKKKEQREQLDCFIKEAEKTGQKAFVKLASTYKKWRGSILNAFSFPYSNGVTEGFNNKIKVLKRISYGLKNFEEYRKRFLLICN